MQDAITYCDNRRLDSVDFICPTLSRDKYGAIYDHYINPILDQREWPEVEVNILDPSSKKTKAGRPINQRRRAPEEEPPIGKRYTQSCMKCNGLNHNSRTCKYVKDHFQDQAEPSNAAGAGTSAARVGTSIAATPPP